MKVVINIQRQKTKKNKNLKVKDRSITATLLRGSLFECHGIWFDKCTSNFA